MFKVAGVKTVVSFVLISACDIAFSMIFLYALAWFCELVLFLIFCLKQVGEIF